MLRADKIAIIGDLHGRYNGLDNEHLETGDFDLVLFVGDLGGGTLKNGLQMIRTISRLRVPGLVMPGNNDSPHLAELKAELAFQAGKSELFRLMGPTSRRGVTPCGFSSHDFETRHGGVTLIAARPCAMGGSECSFADQLARNHGIATIEQSTVRLQELVDSATYDNLIFLGHNGPLGLGGRPSDPWGRDFEPRDRKDAPRDWGDADLSSAVEYARSQNKRIIAVIAGHMHRSERNPRALSTEHEQVSYINAACVPRIQMMREQESHHYVEMNIDLSQARPVTVNEYWKRFG